MPTPSSLLDILLLPAFYLALVAWVAVSLVLLLRGLSGGRRAIALARARQGLVELRRRDLDPPRQMGALVALVATLPDRILLPLGGSVEDDAFGRQLAEAIVAKLGRGSLESLQARARDSIEAHGGGIDSDAFPKLMRLLRYVEGEY